MFPLILLATPLVEGIKNILIDSAVSPVLQGLIVPILPSWVPREYNIEQGINGLQTGIDAINLGISHQATMLASIQSSVSAIGMMSTVGCALSAVNIYQIIKVQQSLNRIEKKMENGFVDLKVFFSGQLQELLDEQQKKRLSQAYSHYLKGLDQLKTSLLIEDALNRKLSLNSSIDVFTKSLAIYDDEEEFCASNTPGKLRRLECCWAITSSIAETYCLQGEYRAAQHCFYNLKKRIITDTSKIKEGATPSNYRFLLNDLHWIYTNDMRLIELKISFLESLKNKEKYIMPEVNSQKHDMDFLFKKTYLPAAKLYIDCLANQGSEHEIRGKIIEKSPSLARLEIPLAHACNMYAHLLSIKDDSEYNDTYLKSSEVTRSFITLLEIFFIGKNDIYYKIDYKDSSIIEYHKASGSKNDIYAEVHYFNYMLRCYLSSGINLIKSGEKEKDKLISLAEQLGMSKSLADYITKNFISYHKQKITEYAKQHAAHVLDKLLQADLIQLSDEAESDLINFESTIPLTEKELLKNRNIIVQQFIQAKEDAIILADSINELINDNDVIVWKIQDKFSIKSVDAVRFVVNCGKAAKEYKEFHKKLSVGKKKLSASDIEILDKIQKSNNFTQKAINKILSWKSLECE